MTTLHYLPTNGIVHLVFDAPGNANVMNAAFQRDFIAAAERLAGESDLKGVILRSAKSMFFAGGDLDGLVQLRPSDAQDCFDAGEALKAAMRRIETLGKPVVACINGAALGGGWELCLMSHARIAVDDPKLQLGLPEVTLGLLPGAGGVTRMVRLLGLQAALPFLLEGKQFAPAEGQRLGLIDQLVASVDDLVPAAESWIAAHAYSQQPWDRKDWRMPGGAPGSPKLGPMLAVAPAMLTARTRGCYPAPKAILACAVEGAQVGFEQASRIESRYFVALACGQVSKNMIGAFWHQLNAIKRGASRPEGYPRGKLERVGILGAGLMGAGIACACAMRGLAVVLKDVDAERAEHGKAYTARVLDKRVAQGRMSEAERNAVLARIQTTADVTGLARCELVIEAVFEDKDLKARVTAETEVVLSAQALFASNTSTLPISGLALASSRPAQFIGLHFFSPADKMPLVEIICGEQTDPATLARAFDFVLQIGKTPIVVGDSRGFFTSRVFGAYNREGIGLVGEGAGAARVENLALQSGFPVGPLAVVDEVGLPLARRIREQTEAALRAAGEPVPEYTASAVVDALLDADRPGKAGRAGFYDYPTDAPKHLWLELDQRYPAPPEPIPDADVRDRMLYIQPIESVRCLDEGVLRTVRDGNIGSIFGIGFPGWTGGVLQFINHVGPAAFVERADELADRYGERFRVPESLRERAQRGERYADVLRVDS